MQRDAQLQMVFRQVREAETHITRQRQIIAEMTRDGHSTVQAKELLMTFEATLLSHKQHLELLRLETGGLCNHVCSDAGLSGRLVMHSGYASLTPLGPAVGLSATAPPLMVPYRPMRAAMSAILRCDARW